jgi:ParB-like chromosome segregation protein Spo0J
MVVKISVIPTNKLTPNRAPTLIDQDKVARYRQMLRSGSRSPPLLVARLPNGNFELLDGHHRWHARIRENWSESECVVVGPGTDEDDQEARLEACGGVRDIWSVRRSRAGG